MINSIDESFLLNTQTYIEFIRFFFEKKHRRLSYQSFANKAGYSTKSYVAEILSGKKHLTLASIEKFSKGLSLNKFLHEYFKQLVSLNIAQRKYPTDHPEIKTIKVKLEEIRLRRKHKKSINLNKIESSKNALMLTDDFPEIFAALGSVQDGSHLEDILARTNISKEKVLKILLAMERTHFILKKDLIYFPITHLLDFEFINSNEYFKKNFINSTKRAIKKLDVPNQEHKSLYLTQTFSINTQDMPRFKSELKDFLINFCNEAEKPNGDGVAELCLSFTLNK